MAGVRGRCRTSRLARQVYTAALLACIGVWAFIEAGNYARGGSSVFHSSTNIAMLDGANSRQLLSGVEVIPGFTGAKCGTNTYVTVPLGTTGVETEVGLTKSQVEAANRAYKPYATWESDSGGIVYVILSIWLFLGIAIICDEQFTQSLNMICSRFGINMDENVAGATFMAAGSSAPELATSFLGTFVAASPVGLGTILGSAVFNILIIIGAVALLSKKELELDFRPVIRDNFFYAVSVILLCVLLAIDDKAQIIDTVLLLLWYIAYLVYLAYNDAMTAILFPYDDEDEKVVEVVSPISQGGGIVGMGDPDATPDGIELSVAPDGEAPAEGEAAKGEAAEGEAASSEEGAATGTGKGAGDDAAPAEEATPEDAPAEEEATPEEATPEEASAKAVGVEKPDHKNSVGLTDEIEEDGDTVLDSIYFFFGAPFIYLFRYTMPDCEHPLLEDDDECEALTEEWNAKYAEADDEEKARMHKECQDSLEGGQRWYWATFFISLLHITWISYFMVEFMLKIGCLWGIPDVVMGLTFLAMGTSIPDALGSIAVANSGKGDMAVSNAVGSNVFDICIGLGLPWFIKLLSVIGDECDHVVIWQASKDVIPSIIILLVIIVVLFAVFIIGDWKLYPQSGYALFAAYGLFIVYQLLNTYVFNKDPEKCNLVCCYK